MSGICYYIIDTETTGIKDNYNEMTEIGIIRCSDRTQLWKKIKCEYPERASLDALMITKKTMADLALGDIKESVVEECEKFFAEDGLTPAHRCIVAHNAPFDKRFLHALWTSCDKAFPANLWLCSMALTRAYAKSQGLMAQGMVKPKFNLHAACDLLQIKKISEAHNAKVDSRNTYLLWKKLFEQQGLDYLPLIKTDIHNPTPQFQGGLDPDLLDIDFND